MTATLLTGPIPDSTTVLVDAALRSLLVAGAVWAGLRILRVHNVLAQKAAWGLMLSGAMLMPLLAPWAARQAWLPSGATVLLPARSWFMTTKAAEEMLHERNSTSPTSKNAASLGPQFRAEPLIPAVTIQPTAPLGDRFPSPLISTSRAHGSSYSEPAERRTWVRGLNFFTGLEALYVLVCAVLLLRIQYGLGSALMLWLEADPISIEAGPEWAAGLRLRASRGVASPVTIGSGIVLPKDYTDWDMEKLRIVLAHERSHVRQCDFYLQICAGLYAALFWFSPLGWWLRRTLSELSEAISDRAGLNEANSRASYAQILLEFAALPRTKFPHQSQIGVAMARPGSLTHRIERLLNDSSFRQAFAGGRRRMLVAILLVPVALFAATVLIRVEASAQTTQAPAPPSAPVPDPAPAAQQSPEADTASPAAVPEPQPAAPSAISPVAPVAPIAPPSAVVPASSLAPVGRIAPEAPIAPISSHAGNMVIVGPGQMLVQSNSGSNSNSNVTISRGSSYSMGKGYAYSYSSNGDSYAVVSGKDQHIHFSGEWHDGPGTEIDKARRMAHGDFLWFTHNGKSYILDDQATVGKIEEMYKPMEELGRQQEELGKKQEELGRQQEALGKQQEEASVPTPDIAKEMAELNAAVAKLQAQKGGTVSQDQIGDLEGKIGDLQGKLGEIQGEIGAKQGRFGAQQGELGRKQGELGEQQGRLGQEQGRIAQETDRKVKSIIDESLSKGTARPVE
jgi:hypothetical protein